MGGLRELAAPFVAVGPSGMAVRGRLRHLTAEDETVLRMVGDHLGALASRDRVPGPRTRSVRAGRGAKAGDQDTRHRSGRPAEHQFWQQDSLPLSL
ncbi:hypothetical protein P9869_37965 [Streptomyces ossamyceticus]|nr:hypothetical protein [Streptomyces ossamyceticus]